MMQKKAIIFMDRWQLQDNLKDEYFNRSAILTEIFGDFITYYDKSPLFGFRGFDFPRFSTMTTEIISHPKCGCGGNDMVFAWGMPKFDQFEDCEHCIAFIRTYTFDDPENEPDDRFGDFLESFIYFDIVHRLMKFFEYGETYFPRGLDRTQSMAVKVWAAAQKISFPLRIEFEDWRHWHEMASQYDL